MCSYLIEHGCEINKIGEKTVSAGDNFSATPLMIAARLENVPLVNYLLENGKLKTCFCPCIN